MAEETFRGNKTVQADSVQLSVTKQALPALLGENWLIQSDDANSDDILFGTEDDQVIRIKPNATAGFSIDNLSKVWVRAVSGTPTLNIFGDR